MDIFASITLNYKVFKRKLHLLVCIYHQNVILLCQLIGNCHILQKRLSDYRYATLFFKLVYHIQRCIVFKRRNKLSIFKCFFHIIEKLVWKSTWDHNIKRQITVKKIPVYLAHGVSWTVYEPLLVAHFHVKLTYKQFFLQC